MRREQKSPPKEPRGRFGRAALRFFETWPSERLIPTGEGLVYVLASFLLLIAGLYQQVNLILLIFTLTAGPFLASIYGGRSMLRRLAVTRRIPSYVFSGDPLAIDYTLENKRRWYPALAVFLEDSLIPAERSTAAGVSVAPILFFARVAAGDRARVRYIGTSPQRGKYLLRDLDLGTRSPFGFVEHRATLAISDHILVYPRIGHLTRRWFQMQRQATESRRGQRHDRSAQQLEYHGLRDYRSGDSPRWIHWRTTARRNELMVKEFEEQNEQDLAILVDPWLPRAKAGASEREALEAAISFAATLCFENCRHQGRRLALGWTGKAPGVRQGPASVKLLHEMLEQLAVMRPVSDGALAELFDLLPPALLREALVVVISTRPINLVEEAERSARLSGASARGLLGRVVSLNATAGDLAPLYQFAEAPARTRLPHRSASAIKERLVSQEAPKRGGPSQDSSAREVPRTGHPDGAPRP